MTEQEMQKLWEWCGFRRHIDLPEWWDGPGGRYFREKLPSLDLDNLFRWAVPKLLSLGYGYLLSSGRLTLYVQGNWLIVPFADDPAEALAQAILKVIGGEV